MTRSPCFSASVHSYPQGKRFSGRSSLQDPFSGGKRSRACRNGEPTPRPASAPSPPDLAQHVPRAAVPCSESSGRGVCPTTRRRHSSWGSELFQQAESQVAVCGLLGERAFLWVEPRCSRVCPVCPPSPPPPRGARARAGEELTVALPGAGTPLCVPRGFGRDRNQGAALAGARRMKRGDAET